MLRLIATLLAICIVPSQAFIHGSPCTPPTPAPAATAGYTTLFQCDPLYTLATVDAAATGNPGYIFYNDYIGSGGHFTMDQASIVASNGGVTLSNANVLGELSTAASINVTPPAYVGMALPNGFYIQVDMKFPGIDGGSGWPAFWSASTERLTVTPLAANGLEIDCAEFKTTTQHTNVYIAANGSQTYSYQNATSFVADTNWHTYGCMWQPANRNGGTGLFTYYVDGTQVFQLAYSNSVQSALMAVDTQTMYAMLQTNGEGVTYRNFYAWVAP
jgi:hypothetical protein